MGQNSKIEWTHHTFNPWWGCVRVSPACKHCYAESWAKRVGVEVWGKNSERRFFSDHHWAEPFKWNREAATARVRRRVFCASMADVFENRRDLDVWRAKLWPIIENTPWLDWLLLTKRPQHIGHLAPWRERWPRNVWLGTTAESQKWANERVERLMRFPVTVRFASCEPLLGEVDLTPWLAPESTGRGLNWVIAGGESGVKSRPMNPAWAESLRDQCEAVQVPFHFKQWGHWGPYANGPTTRVQTIQMTDRLGNPIRLFKLGKRASGRLLDGITWDKVPQASNAR
jgi:protein gp37